MNNHGLGKYALSYKAVSVYVDKENSNLKSFQAITIGELKCNEILGNTKTQSVQSEQPSEIVQFVIKVWQASTEEFVLCLHGPMP